MKEIIIYTDGGCRGNPGKGAWAAILMYGNNKKEITGFSENTTNNIMEITAVIKGLEMLKESCYVSVYSDSNYVVNSVEKGWINKWQQKNWTKYNVITKEVEEVKNKELFQRLFELINIHKVKFIKVKGHSDNELNNRCDLLVNETMDSNII